MYVPWHVAVILSGLMLLCQQPADREVRVQLITFKVSDGSGSQPTKFVQAVVKVVNLGQACSAA